VSGPTSVLKPDTTIQAHLIADFYQIARASPSEFMRELGVVPAPLADMIYCDIADDRAARNGSAFRSELLRPTLV
jgi:hypothetical protein